jgi:hypothetical protein
VRKGGKWGRLGEKNSEKQRKGHKKRGFDVWRKKASEEREGKVGGNGRDLERIYRKKTKKQICAFFIHGKGREEYIRNNSCKCIELNKARWILENQK